MTLVADCADLRAPRTVHDGTRDQQSFSHNWRAPSSPRGRMTDKENQESRMDTKGEGDTSRTASDALAGSQRSLTPNQVTNEHDETCRGWHGNYPPKMDAQFCTCRARQNPMI